MITWLHEGLYSETPLQNSKEMLIVDIIVYQTINMFYGLNSTHTAKLVWPNDTSHSAQIQQLTLVQKWSSAHNIGLGSGPEHDQLVISMNHLLLVCVVCDFWPPSRVCDPLPSYLPPPLSSMYASAFRICVFLMDTMSVHVWWYYPSTF